MPARGSSAFCKTRRSIFTWLRLSVAVTLELTLWKAISALHIPGQESSAVTVHSTAGTHTAEKVCHTLHYVTWNGLRILDAGGSPADGGEGRLAVQQQIQLLQPFLSSPGRSGYSQA